jgi:uncharacterized phage protein (TIGR01671 family)
MRPIKFRAWFVPLDWDTEQKKPGRMVYFDEIGYCDEYNHLRFQLASASRDSGGGDYGNLSGKFEDFESVMQFTGLLDKNGNDIYEGDILKSEEGIGSVKYEGNGFWCSFEKPRHRSGNYFPAEIDREIIGNIHENGDLFK